MVTFAVRQLADHCRKAPDEITEAELRRYFLYLKNQRKFAYGSLRVALSGIRFFIVPPASGIGTSWRCCG